MKDLFPETSERIASWKKDPGVLGVVLVGSASHAGADSHSDDDLEVILTSDAFAALDASKILEVAMRREAPQQLAWDAQRLPLEQLERKADSVRDIDHWPYQHAKVLFDRDGRVSEAVRRASSMSESFRAKRIVHAAMSAWILVHRVKKTVRRQLPTATAALTAKGTRALIRVVFALDGKWVPLEHWLDLELAELETAADVVPLLRSAIEKGDPDCLTRAFESVESRLEPFGFPERADRRALWAELMHPDCAEEVRLHEVH